MSGYSVDGAIQVSETAVLHRVIRLLKERQGVPSTNDLHIDIGAPTKAHADAWLKATGSAYVGITLDPVDQMTVIRDRCEFYHIGKTEPFAERLNAIIGSRKVVSISLLDQIERLTDIDVMLRQLAEVAHAKRAFVAISALNEAYLGAAVALMFGSKGRNAETRQEEATRSIDHERLTRLLSDAGLHVIDRDDVVSEGDQFQHPLLRPGLSIGSLLIDTAKRVNPTATVRQFVWLCTTGPIAWTLPPQDSIVLKRPFLTAVIRTQGRRLHTLVEALVCLGGQSNDDFEAVIVGHKLDAPGLNAVRQVIDDMPESLRRKISLLHVAEGGRTRPLNVGFQHARGEYIAILDDDDIPMGHWVAEFSKLARNHQGRVLRTACVRQDSVNVEIFGKRGLRATGELATLFPSTYSFLEHFLVNYSPPICLAFPREAFHCLGLRFDERLSTCEDWDFLLQAAALCGVADSPEITGIYRWWPTENSKSAHPKEQWDKDSSFIRDKLDDTWIILPKGEGSRIIGLLEDRDRLLKTRDRVREIESERDDAGNRLRLVEREYYDASSRGRILLRLARPMRRHVKRRIMMFRLRRALSFWSSRRRRRLDAKIEEYQGYLHQF